MRRFVSGILGITLGITPILTSAPTTFAQGIPPSNAQDTLQVERVGNSDFHPTRRQLRKRARGRQAVEASSFIEQRMENRKTQQKRTMDNIRPEQRRERLQDKKRLDGFMERKGGQMMDTHERMSPRKAPGLRKGKNIEYLPTRKRSRPGETRMRPERDPCTNIIGTRKARCYYRLQRMTVPGT